jgi:hypothetical protein
VLPERNLGLLPSEAASLFLHVLEKMGISSANAEVSGLQQLYRGGPQRDMLGGAHREICSLQRNSFKAQHRGHRSPDLPFDRRWHQQIGCIRLFGRPLTVTLISSDSNQRWLVDGYRHQFLFQREITNISTAVK